MLYLEAAELTLLHNWSLINMLITSLLYFKFAIILSLCWLLLQINSIVLDKYQQKHRLSNFKYFLLLNSQCCKSPLRLYKQTIFEGKTDTFTQCMEICTISALKANFTELAKKCPKLNAEGHSMCAYLFMESAILIDAFFQLILLFSRERSN